MNPRYALGYNLGHSGVEGAAGVEVWNMLMRAYGDWCHGLCIGPSTTNAVVSKQ